jgi:hypothetical protein
VHLEPFRTCAKLAAKLAKLVQLMQKFVPWCPVRIFRNERSRSTALDCKLKFWCVPFRLGAFGTVRYCTKLGANKLVELMQNFVPWCLFRFFHNEHSQSTPLDLKHMFWCVPFRFSAFGTVSLLHETWCKMHQTGAINAKVCATMSCRNFSQRTLPIHTIGP